jgi:hypothetical protein
MSSDDRGKCEIPNCRCVGYDSDVTRSTTCYCDHRRYEHTRFLPPPVALGSPRNAAGSPGRPSPGGASARCAVIFEKEVNKHVVDHFPSSLPGCEFSGFRSREIVDDETGNSLLEIDTFGYILRDNGEDGKETRPNGIYLILPRRLAKS